jgi:hypothetical protein
LLRLDLRQANELAKEIQARWKMAGQIPDQYKSEVFNQFNAISDRIFESSYLARVVHTKYPDFRMMNQAEQLQAKIEAMDEIIIKEDMNVKVTQAEFEFMSAEERATDENRSRFSRLNTSVRKLRMKNKILFELKRDLDQLGNSSYQSQNRGGYSSRPHGYGSGEQNPGYNRNREGGYNRENGYGNSAPGSGYQRQGSSYGNSAPGTGYQRDGSSYGNRPSNPSYNRENGYGNRDYNRDNGYGNRENTNRDNGYGNRESSSYGNRDNTNTNRDNGYGNRESSSYGNRDNTNRDNGYGNRESSSYGNRDSGYQRSSPSYENREGNRYGSGERRQYGERNQDNGYQPRQSGNYSNDQSKNHENKPEKPETGENS